MTNTNVIKEMKMFWYITCYGLVISGLHRAWKLATSNQGSSLTTCVLFMLSVMEIIMKLQHDKHKPLEADLTDQLASPLESDEILSTQRSILEHNIDKRSLDYVFTEEIDVQSSPLPGRSLNDRIFESVGDVYNGVLMKYQAKAAVVSPTTTTLLDPDMEHFITYHPGNEVEEMRMFMSMLNRKKLKTTPFTRKPISTPPIAQFFDINITPIVPEMLVVPSRRFMEPGKAETGINQKFQPPMGRGIAFPGRVLPSAPRLPADAPLLPDEKMSPLERFRALYGATTIPTLRTRKSKAQPVRVVPVKPINSYATTTKAKDIEVGDSIKLPEELKEEEMEEEENLFDIPEFKAEASYSKPEVLTYTDKKITEDKTPDTRRMPKFKSSDMALSEIEDTSFDVIKSVKKPFKAKVKKPKIKDEDDYKNYDSIKAAKKTFRARPKKNRHHYKSSTVKEPQFEAMNTYRKTKILAEMEDDYEDDNDFFPNKPSFEKFVKKQPDLTIPNKDKVPLLGTPKNGSNQLPIPANSLSKNDSTDHFIKLLNILENKYSDNEDIHINKFDKKIINAATESVLKLSRSKFNTIGSEKQESNTDLQKVLIPGAEENHSTGEESGGEDNNNDDEKKEVSSISGIPIRRRRNKVTKRT